MPPKLIDNIVNMFNINISDDFGAFFEGTSGLEQGRGKKTVLRCAEFKHQFDS